MTAFHCWTGRNCPPNLDDPTEGACFGCSHPDCRYGAAFDASGTCMLEAGHDGPHEWTLDTDITIHFGDAP